MTQHVTDKRGGHGRQLRPAQQVDVFNIGGEQRVDAGHRPLMFVVARRADAPHDGAGAAAPHLVHEQAAERLDLDPGHPGNRSAEQLHAFIQFEQAGLAGGRNHHRDAVEQSTGALEIGRAPCRERV